MSNELLYWIALKAIAKSDSPEWLRKHSEKAYGLSYHEALEMAYENLQALAINATYKKRKPSF